MEIKLLKYNFIGQVGAWMALPSSYAVEVQDESDIVNAVRFAKNFNLRLVVKGTGMNNIYSYVTKIMIFNNYIFLN